MLEHLSGSGFPVGFVGAWRVLQNTFSGTLGT